ncbi:MAG: methyltransferase domain-containing protein [Candidatus Omnitrophica bacterium]|nr:methyltransferase domain-containing protein [Candidatus Omnitrophota bacterium]
MEEPSMIRQKLKKAARKIRRAILRDEPGYYDMFMNKGEHFFGRLYLHEITRILEEEKRNPPLKILDAGCQSGRLTVPLAAAGHDVTGVDTSDLALRRARKHAAEMKTSFRPVRADLSSWLPKQPQGFFDAVLCTEVLYMRENHLELLEGLLKVLKPGGLCFISHRPTGYYLAEAFRKGDKQAIETLTGASEGILFGSYYNWQSREELRTLYSRFPVEVLSIVPIGFLSWAVIDPSGLEPEMEELLFQVETAPEHRQNDCGRYLLVSARKKTS